jgi:hypothetical protein
VFSCEYENKHQNIEIKRNLCRIFQNYSNIFKYLCIFEIKLFTMATKKILK